MITFDENNGLLYVSLKHQDYFANTKTESIDIGDGVILEKAEDGEIVGISLLNREKSQHIIDAMERFVDVPKKNKKKLDSNT